MLYRFQIRYRIDELNRLTKLYDEGHPEVSDEEYDKLYFELQEAEEKYGLIYPDSPTQSINYQVVSKLKKIEHNHKMLSLAKTKELSDVISFVGNKEYVVMLKMDGLSCSLRYLNGKLVSAETRGNGLVGEDITHNAFVIPSIPKEIECKNEVVVDGEIICTYDNFEAFSSEYKNPRNFASGSIRLLDSNECAKRKLTFVAWDYINYNAAKNLMNKRLLELSELGFLTVPYEIIDSKSEKELNNLIKDFQTTAQELSYPIDGLVFKYNDIEYGQALGETAHHKNDAIAFKFYDEVYETTLIEVDWGMGRTGTLCPIAIFEPIEVDDGTTIERASIHNVSIMKSLYDKHWYKGLKLNVIKSNMIIPQIVSVDGAENNDDFDVPAVCPVCGGSTEIKESDVGVQELYCTNPECCGKSINIIEHFLCKKGLDAKGISKATIEKLLDWGWINNIADVFNLAQYRAEWIKKPGFGAKSVDNMLAAIEESKHTTLDKFISAIGIPLIGSTVAKEIAKREKTWEQFRKDVNEKYAFYEWPGFGVVMSESLWKYDYSLADKIAATLEFAETEPTDAQGLTGLNFVITGSLGHFKNRDELKKKIESNGGKVVGSVSKNTSYLINNNINSTSSKNREAKQLNIPIITEEEFIKKFFEEI